MDTRSRYRSLLLLLAFTHCTPTRPPAALVERVASAAAVPAPATPLPVGSRLSLWLSYCGRPDCELRFTFSLPMVAADALATSKAPDVTFDPPVAGRFHWDTVQSLVFLPEPGALSWGQTIRLSLTNAVPQAGAEHALAAWTGTVSVPPFQAAGKVATWPIVVGQPRFVDLLDDRADKIGRGPLFLLFDQPVDPHVVAAGLGTADGSGRRLRRRVERPASTGAVWAGVVPLENLVTVTLVDVPPAGETVVLTVPSHEDGNVARRTLTVAGPLTVAVAEGPDPHRARLNAIWRLHFSNPVRSEAVREALKLQPPEEMRIDAWGGDVAIHATLKPGVRYQVTLDPAFRDIFGHALARPFARRFRAQDLPPSLEVPRDALLLERGHARLPLRARNVGRARARSFALGTEAFIRASVAPEPPSCEAVGVRSHLALGPLEPGALNDVVQPSVRLLASVPSALLCVDVSAVGRGTEANGDEHKRVLVQVSGLGLTAKVSADGVLVWVTRLRDARPAVDAAVRLVDVNGGALVSGRTGGDGVALLPASGLPARFFAVAETAADTAIAEISEARLSQPWQFGMAGAVKDGEPLAASVFTERGAYRPEETVHVKAIVREPSAEPIAVLVKDPRGQQVVALSLALDAFGAAAVDLKLKPQSPVGEYSLSVTHSGRSAFRTFRVEEYRVPTFDVKLKTDEAEWKRGEDVHAAAEAEYLHGGALGGREVHWQVLREREPFLPAAFPGFVFAVAEVGSAAGPVASGDGKLDGAGRLVFSFKPDHDASAGPMRYTVEASVTDVDRQAYAGRISRVVHPAAIYLGARPPAKHVLAVGEALEVPVVAVRPDGRPQAGVSVHARLERMDYHTTARWSGGGVQLMNHAEPAAAGACDVVSVPAPSVCRFPLESAGEFRVVISAEDAAGQAVAAGFDVSVVGGTPAAWPRFDQDRVDLVADRAVYHPGETATLVVKTPFTHARGLLTLERDGVLQHRLIRIAGDTPRIEVPIDDTHAPNIFASVVLLRGRVHFEKDATGFETGAPAFKMGYASLRVQPRAQALAVTVGAAPQAAPKGKLGIDLEVRDEKGAPHAGQATLMVVDEAVLGLTRYRTPDPIAEMYLPRPLGVRTSESRLELPYARRARHEQIFPGGDGGDGFGLGQNPADLRSLFESTAYWNADVRIGEDGCGHVVVDLPDNVTTYRIMAVVTDGHGRAGAADRKVVVRKPLMVQAVLPRFAYPDDRMTIEALVWNGTDRTGVVRWRASVTGLSLEPDARSEQESEVKPGASVSFRLPVRVIARDRMVVRFAAELGADHDAVEVSLPVLNPGSRRTIVAQADAESDGKLVVDVPAGRQPGTTTLEVLVSSTSLTSLKGAVEYLMQYPNGCIEQTTSTAYPLVVLPDLLPEMGVTVNPAELRKFSEAGVKRILSFQTSAGGLSYWPGSDQPHAFATAFGLTALIEAKKRGYDVPDASLARMADFLEAALKSGHITGEMPHAAIADGDTRALFVMTLGRLGRPQPAYINALWHDKEKLTPFGLSFLAVAVSEMKGDQSLLPAILADIRAAARSDRDEAWYEGHDRGGWSMDSPLRTHAAALLAHADGAPGSEMGGKLLTGLLKRQKYGMWGNTQENVFGIMGVVALAGNPNASAAGPQMELLVDGHPIRVEQMEKVSAHVLRFAMGEAELGLVPGQPRKITIELKRRGGPPTYVTARASYEADLDAHNRAARAEGFEISRRYETLTGEPLDDKPVPLGSVVRVRLSVTAREAQNYVAIDDRLPAGLEPMNASLATTTTASLGTVSDVAARSLSRLSYSELRDARAAFFVDEMPAGQYEYVYLARATTPGTFRRPAGSAEAMYRPDVNGATAIDEVSVQ
jgi:uncharacterized protein YfaS (alpha-2-macroglobulin family)